MKLQLPEWAKKIEKNLKTKTRISPVPGRTPPYAKQGKILSHGIRLLVAARGKKNPLKSTLILEQQPFDAELLSCSPLFRRSREWFLEEGGRFVPSLLSSPRSLTSASLLEPRIEYSPIESEMIWAATDEIESRTFARLLELRTFSTSLFHEQNHRVLWGFLPAPPRKREGLRKYLNFVESLVITLDMALADQLSSNLARVFYLAGVIYDPGTLVFSEVTSPRVYRNYLHAALHATYLNLEGYEADGIVKVTQALFPNLGPLAARAAERSGNLDRAFIEETNAIWQMKHERVIFKKLCTAKKSVLNLPDSPMDNRQQYLLAEKFFEMMGL